MPKNRGKGGGAAAGPVESKYIGVGGGWAGQNENMSEDTKQYLQEVERRDHEMEEIELSRVGDGVSQLKQVAIDMNERIKAQNAELDPIAGKLAGHREGIGVVNVRLRAAAKKGKRWGSFGRNLACMLILVGQLFALGFTIDFVIKERRAAVRAQRGGV